MPRIPRSQLPTPAYYHVICRGVEQRKLFLDDIDRTEWRKLLVDVERRFGWRIHVWTLLDNHFHVLIETTQPELSRGMQRLNGLYAMRFNRRYARKGHLFQGRFESRVVDSDEYLAVVTEYIYENATRVGLVRWPWRGFGSPGAALPGVAGLCDYACPRTGHGRRNQPQRAPRRGDRPQRRRRRHPPGRGARPLQRTRSPLGALRGVRRTAGTACDRSRRGGLRRLDRTRCPDRGSRKAREPPVVPARGAWARDPPRPDDLRARSSPRGPRHGRVGARGTAPA